jgi:HTH-type transcriptional regulator/antitoxin HigA
MSIKKEAISNEKSYKLALKKVDDLMKLGSQKITFDQAKEITTLAKSIQTYEKNIYTITPPTTLAGMIELRMYEMKFKQVELAKLLGISNTKLSLILSGKQKADLQFIKSIHKELKINAEFILQSI